MKAKIGQVEIEGTAAEIAELLKVLERPQIDLNGPFQSSRLLMSDEPDSSEAFISEDVAFRMIKRRPLSKEQSLTLTTLLHADQQWVTAKVLQAKLSYSSSQLGGMLGAFGKRLASTEGYIKGQWLFDQEWNYHEGCNHYRLPDSVMRAVKRAGL